MAGTGELQMMMIGALDREVEGGEPWVARRKEVYQSLEDWRSTFRLEQVEGLQPRPQDPTKLHQGSSSQSCLKWEAWTMGRDSEIL